VTSELSLPVLCGQLLVGGFLGTELTASFKDALARGERGGAILFRRNLEGSLEDVAALNRSIAATAPVELPPLLGIDQEGGRVTRLGSPLLRLPTMRAFGLAFARSGDAGLVARAAEALGRELAALGFTMDFAPVLDVDTCAKNPIIGDRSFGSDPAVVARLGAAYASGLQAGGVLACGKHFPGHGDTTTDSHLELPRVDQRRARLLAVECAPFAPLRMATCAAFMSAHVVYPALDPDQPATLSRAIAHDLLRTELGFDGLLISDDLEMKAVADRLPIEESAVRAVRAGCDVLLICKSEELQARAHTALIHAAEKDRSFRAEIAAKVARALEARRRCRPRPLANGELRGVIGGARSQAIARELEESGVFAGGSP
jgi:beta-N-acetylhexosaminidase